MMNRCLLAVGVVFISILQLVFGKGQVSLDSHNFDKILSKFHTTLVKFDAAFPFGPKHEAFLVVAETSKHKPDFLVAEVGVKDYGDRDNEDLVKRFKLDSKQFPVYLLFVQGNEKPYSYHGSSDEDYSADKIISFVRSKDTGIWIGAPGCLQDFDRLAKQFIQSACPHQRKGLLKSSEDLWDNVQTQSARRSAEVYVKTMRKLLELGGAAARSATMPPGHGGNEEKSTNENVKTDSNKESEYLSREKSRITGLLREKMSDQKKEDLKARLNILDSFALYVRKDGENSVRDEL
uniref:Endoplasmic reticulum resident protein 29 n=1 Tax=Cacopsylla melanoneura TaxID=428564 RepID=A0A8D8XE49_9HEMI